MMHISSGNHLNLDEKLKIANKIRESDTVNRDLSSILEKFPVKESREMYVRTRNGETRVIIHYPLGGSTAYPVYVNIHGGGFIKGHQEQDTLFCRKIAYALDCVVVDIDYKVAPEKMFPYALYECYDIVKWVYDNPELLSIDRNRIVVGGHSAGGTLTAGLMLMAKESKEFDVKLQILDYPPLDLYTDPALKKNTDITIPVEKARAYNDLYIDPADRKKPLASPVYASVEMLKGLPPTVILSAELDNLCEEAEKFAMQLIEAGVKVTAKRFLGCEHGFTVKNTGDYKEAEEMIISCLQEVFKKK
ncbi:alpha/beta hydrolase [Bacillus sp. Marseille-P3661]|uniref:alpha/beta hydrolase n=1 Tax=Bacillus sp. Marseille-P3661 TaxID=1936234 RepID=UPI000C8395D0|nr:alpha/beta hydrolase [Bacillus sp. Marseille-P3661]